ncbi:hypothetical protein P152DRAFT_175630 [Eremomyces bilateralis CBS 781.70]|uniref:D-mandelate dehydrogenase n=1 Tax=Eremomyces bilateralis CBS 781.70 TaxID=1392243 RepID=A0A6G1FTT8_9PEZI|nr:uncharacterized protein P152DRAFT_175630 [Eremomyces bilateralis CBS 781.70]KAF1809081.1 hypothetical protein P152DRAFT_175630 [Eremomyces bilateralis CBS 781.70]
MESKPIILHLGDDIKWNHDLYQKLQERFEIRRSYKMDRGAFIKALKTKKFGNFVAIYRPFWNTGGEMGKWDRELISLLPNSCKISASAGAGFDWVDTKVMADHGIVYCNAASACTESVADAAIWLILSTYRLFSWSSQAARSLSVSEFVDANRNIAAISNNPSGSTLGIIGLGRIGFRVAQKAQQCFGMRIIYHDVMRMDIKKSIDAEFHSLQTMLGKADCVLIATPFNGDQLLSQEHFRMMKRGSRLVNVARGKLLDEDALIEALESGQLSAAGLDVHFNEPVLNPRLVKMRNVELLSHTAGASLESHIGFERLGMENILSFFETGKAISPVNLQMMAKF